MPFIESGKQGKKQVKEVCGDELCFKYVKFERPSKYASGNFEWAVGSDSLDRAWRGDLS